MRNLVIITFLFFYSLVSTRQVKESEESILQAEFYASASQIKELMDSYGIGIGLDYKMDLFLFGTEISTFTKAIGGGYESDHYLNIDFFGGIHKKIKKFDISIATGVGLSIRDEGKYDLFLQEESYTKLALPIRVKANYFINDKFLIGFGVHSSLTSKVDIYSIFFSIGYQF
jgi:hypothetical protein